MNYRKPELVGYSALQSIQETSTGKGNLEVDHEVAQIRSDPAYQADE